MPNITLANGENKNLISEQSFTFYSSRTGYMTLNLALSNLDQTAHTATLTANWS